MDKWCFNISICVDGDLKMKDVNLSTVTEPQIVISKDGKTAIKYKVVQEIINLEALKQEKESLEEQLEMPEPSDKELLEEAKFSHPYYQQDWVENRIIVINKILGVK